jgi:superfamily II RNA helicase
VAASIQAANELVLAELIFNGAFNNMSYEQVGWWGQCQGV